MGAPRPLVPTTPGAIRRWASETLSTVNGSAWDRLLTLTGHTCAYCGKQSARLQKDHVIPTSRGGLTTLFNLVPICPEDNREKGTQEALVFIVSKGYNLSNFLLARAAAIRVAGGLS